MGGRRRKHRGGCPTTTAAALLVTTLAASAAKTSAVPTTTFAAAAAAPTSAFQHAHAAAILRGGATPPQNNNNIHTEEASSSSPHKSTHKAKRKKKRTPTTNHQKHRGNDRSTGGSTKETNDANDEKTNPVVQEILKEDDYYRILGTTRENVEKSHHPDRLLKKCYRKRCLQTHPDKIGSGSSSDDTRRAFDKVAEAYEGLQDADQRQKYDRFGKAGVHPQHAGSGAAFSSADDLFRSFFGSQHPFAARQEQHRVPRFHLEVSLEDMYRGTSVRVQLPTHQTTVEVDIPRGATDGETIAVSDDDASDVLLQLRQRPHATFARRGRHDLVLTLKVRLSEALTGVQRRVRHLDGTWLHLVSAADDSHQGPAPIRTGDVHVLPGRGMPRDAAGTDYGDLYVRYEVVEPPLSNNNNNNTRLDAAERRQLRRLLQKLEGKPSPASSSDWPFVKNDDDTVQQLQRASRSDFERASRPQQPPPEGFAGFSPFGSNGQRFYWSSGATNPFFGGGGGGGSEFGGDDDEGETQCRQM